jgi:glycosyltransferase involved in cell wall biosynthesis
MAQVLDFYLLIPCYNNVSGLKRSLDSVVYPRERYGILIVDDGCEIPLTMDKLGNDLPESTHILRLSVNAGITSALNTGLRWLEKRKDYRFVARLDCGDICCADRFRRQVTFLRTRPEIDLLGSWVQFRDFSSGLSYQYKTPVDQRRIVRGMHFRNLFIHPAVMWRASVLGRISRYPYDLPFAEDYGFFYKILEEGQAAILPEVLTICEINPNGLSLQYRRQQLKSRIKAVARHRKNNLLGWMGTLKLLLLLLVPYRMLLQIKSFIW